MKTNKKARRLGAKIILIGLLATATFATLMIGGCTDGESTESGYTQISPQRAKEIMDSGRECVIIDARTESEYAEGHIEGAILLPEYEVGERAEELLPDKDALILVYCRSGRRSKIAAEELSRLGYTNVLEFGGIIDWPYEIQN